MNVKNIPQKSLYQMKVKESMDVTEQCIVYKQLLSAAGSPRFLLIFKKSFGGQPRGKKFLFCAITNAPQDSSSSRVD